MAELAGLPTLGWVTTPAPVSALPGLGRQVGAAWLGAKRDDLLEALHGGSKVRKLDALLALPPWSEAPAWASFGAIGSGHLACVSAAAQKLGRAFDGFLFWEPLSDGVLDNLALTAAGARALRYFGSRVALGLGQPRALLGTRLGDAAVIPPGATNSVGTLGLVRAGVELAEQIAAGLLPRPHRIYVAWGTGGTAAGLAVGLGLAGVDTTVIAVATVERLLSPQARLRQVVEQVRRELEARGVPRVRERPPARLVVERGQLGPGYGRATAQSLAACELARGDGLHLEPIYTGKAMAALLAAAPRAENVLFWHTARRAAPRPEGWKDKLPPALRARLDGATRPPVTRRRVLWTGAALGAGALGWHRLTGYAALPGWSGQVLSAREAQILAAAAEALLLGDAPGPAPLAVAAHADRFLATFTAPALREVHLLFNVIEHATTPLGLWGHRFTRLEPAQREAFLASLGARGGLLAQAYRGLRDLCLLGHYADPESWPALAYAGPTRSRDAPAAPGPYEALRARPGELPRGAAR